MDVCVVMVRVVMSMMVRVDFMIPVIPVDGGIRIPEIGEGATPAEVAHFNLNPLPLIRNPLLHNLKNILMAGPASPRRRG